MAKSFVLIIGMLLLSCDSPSVPVVEGVMEIHDVFFDYNQENLAFWLQADIFPSSPETDIDSVWFQLESLTGQVELSSGLVDNGENGDIIPGNQVFSQSLTLDTPIPFNTYRLIIFAADNTGQLDSKVTIVTIDQEYPPVISGIEMPSEFYLDPVQWGSLTIRAVIDDGNGHDDIRWVRYSINTDYLTIDCEGNINNNPQEDHYQDDPSWSMNYVSTNNEGQHIYETVIPMRPVDDGEGGCGKTGLALFRITVQDKTNQSDVITELPLDIFSCGDGICQSGYEDNLTCGEDCSE